MIRIRNIERLIGNGETSLLCNARRIALQMLENAVNAVDPHSVIKSKVSLSGSILNVERFRYDLSKYRHVYVVGGGKASGAMAEALDDIMGSHVTEGTINVPYGSQCKTSSIAINEASHPIPDESGVRGAQKILDIAEKAGKNDFIIFLISGGGSSLLPLPRGKVSLADKQKLTNMLLKSGATIDEINIVRKHVSAIKGGWLAKQSYPATVLSLILSDVVGDSLSSIASGPTVPDSYTFADARRVLDKYSLWKSAPSAVRDLIIDGESGLIPDTPKASDRAFDNVRNLIIGNNKLALNAACAYAKEQGLNSLLLTTTLEGEARHVGTVFASIAREVLDSGNPTRKPAAIIAGGETTVFVTGNGLGGRNQELALSAALKLGNANTVAFACLNTDGVDGPIDAAGAIIDGHTLNRAKKLGMNPEEYLAQNDSYHFFESLDDLIFTGATGTNVNDVVALVIL